MLCGVEYGIALAKCVLKSKPCSNRNLSDAGSTVKLFFRSSITLKVCTRKFELFFTSFAFSAFFWKTEMPTERMERVFATSQKALYRSFESLRKKYDQIIANDNSTR